MFTKRNVKLAVLFLILMTGGYFIVGQITWAQRDAELQANDPEMIERMLPGRDLNERPPIVNELKAMVLGTPTATGNVLVTIRFAPEERVPNRIAIHIGENTAIFNDDGVSGDVNPRDGIHSGIARVDLAELRADRIRIAGTTADTVPIFRGRDVFGLRKIDRSPVPPVFLPNVPFDIFPVGDPDNIRADNSLMITDVNVVQDPSRTRATCGTGSVGTPSMGKWSFGYLMQQMAPQPPQFPDPSLPAMTPEEFVLRWLNRWKHSQVPNDLVITPRTTGMNNFLATWPKNTDGSLDLSRAPFRLLAIVNRADLRGSFSYGGGGSDNGGELRFVFGAVGPPPTCIPQPFTVIFEYGVKKNSCTTMRNWAREWTDLKNFALGTPAYNAALEAITEQIVTANADPAKPNGSALNQLRTNERFLGIPWELREFQILSFNGGHLEQVTVKQTPALGFNNTTTLGNFINDNEDTVLLDKHTVPLTIGVNLDPFLGGGIRIPGDSTTFRWTAPNISNPEARFHFSLQTCSSCHAGESQTPLFTHVEIATFGDPVVLSQFLTGKSPDVNDDDVLEVTEPIGTVHEFNDLRRRAIDLDALARSPCGLHVGIRPLGRLMVH